VARADLHVSEKETRAMRRIVREEEDLPEEQAALVVEMAQARNELFGATESFLVAREFEGLADRKQKLGLLRCLFAVSASDESISHAEDSEIRRISRELKLEHADFIAARSSFRHHLEVLRRPGEGGEGE
jgi:uncharacterized tellurite resistance protein B-like protein